MTDGKLENLLELSLQTPQAEREKSEDLSAGYDPQTRLWEVIVRYSGEAAGLEPYAESVTALLGGYYIVRVTRENLTRLSALPEVEYIEKPKALYFAVYDAVLASCIQPVRRPPYGLDGRGVIVGIVDSGVDIYHPDFRNEDGTTRIIGFWDQAAEGDGPPGYPMGRYYTEEELNRILESPERRTGFDLSGHGTHVAGIAAGNGRASLSENQGVAYAADILVVKLRPRRAGGFPQTAELMMAADFCVRTAISRAQPLALNLSYGNNYGAHNGTSLIETYLDTLAGTGRTTICVGSGNSGQEGRHASGLVRTGESYRSEFILAPGELSFSLQIWKNYTDRFRIVLSAPSGSRVTLTENTEGVYRYVLDGTDILWYFGLPVPYSIRQEIYVEFLPQDGYESVQSGVWKLDIYGEDVVDGEIEFWMPGGSSLSTETRFLVPAGSRTLTIPSTARKPVAVAAYDSNTRSVAPFSGRGYVCCDLVKPDLAAPGVGILSCAPGGGYTVKSGTSMACPFVTGSAALLMQYGIVNGRDPYLYGEKVKAYLQRGAKKIPALQEYPNDQIGWGVLCLADSLPEN